MKKITIQKKVEEAKKEEVKAPKSIQIQKSKVIDAKTQESAEGVTKVEIPAEKTQNEAQIDEKAESKKKSIWWELFRFVVVGIVATLVDFVVELGVVQAFGFTDWNTYSWGSYAIWAIAVTVGFLVSTLVNYLLSFIWVFQNVDKKKTKRSGKNLALFTFLSFIGLLLGIGLQLLGNWTVDVLWGIDLGDLTTGFIDNLTTDTVTALAFCAVFVIKTAVTMVYNFVSRKLFIFKKPKEESQSL